MTVSLLYAVVRAKNKQDNDEDEMTTTHSSSTSHVFIQLFYKFFMTLANLLHQKMIVIQWA